MDPFLVGEDLKNALTILPPYNDSIRSASKAERLLALNNIFDVYYPSVMAAEIYSKLYLAYVRARQKKNTLTAIRQGYENRKAAKGQFYKGIIAQTGLTNEESEILCGFIDKKDALAISEFLKGKKIDNVVKGTWKLIWSATR